LAYREFDYVVIGAGPSAIAALSALDGTTSVAVVSGASNELLSQARIHPKIQAVSVANKERPGVVYSFQREDSPSHPLFSSALAGGLANYWGQQFVRYQPSDPWPRDIFSNYDSYQSHCSELENLFVLSDVNEIQPQAKLDSGYTLCTPRLLLGSAESPDSKLMAMRLEFYRQAKRRHAEVYEERVRSIIKVADKCHVLLQNKETIIAKTVLLAAGVIGTAHLISRSFPEIESMQFSDHAPWMLYTIGLQDVYKLRPNSGMNHFNALTLEKTNTCASEVFVSLYDMGKADFNLLLASTIGRTFDVFRNIQAPLGASLIKPVQIWTPKSFDDVTIDVKSGLVKTGSKAGLMAENDSQLHQTMNVLRALGARCLKVSRTAPGYGFHYHNLMIKEASQNLLPASEFFENKFGKSVKCIDASILPSIGLRPHTLTAMAASHSMVKALQ
jgi:hypothetical protein